VQRNPAIPEAFAAIVHKLMAKAPEQRFASAGAVENALKPWRSPDDQPLEKQGDALYQKAIQQVIDGWTAPEPAKEAVEDAVLFRIDPEDRLPATEIVSRSIFSEIDSRRLHVGLIVAVTVWGVLLGFCGLAACLLTMLR
jgi:hypothetical protein